MRRGLLYFLNLPFFSLLFFVIFLWRCFSSFFVFVICNFLFLVEYSESLADQFLKSWISICLFIYHFQRWIIGNLQIGFFIGLLRNCIFLGIEVREYFLICTKFIKLCLEHYTCAIMELLQLTFEPTTFHYILPLFNGIFFFVFNTIE